jgi:hypothetical protein
MKTISFLFSAILFCTQVDAQDATIRTLQIESLRKIKMDVNDTTKRPWKAGGLYNLAAGQGALSNWAAGGDDFSLTINSLLNLFAFYRKGKNSWDNSLDINLGYLKTTSLGGRKNDDRLDLFSKYGYALSPRLNLSTVFDFRSQFFKGYTYSDTIRTFSSAFMAPAYILVSQGLDYKPVKNLSIYLSPITTRWVIVNNDTLSAKRAYGVDSGKHSINGIGAYATINFIKEVNKHLTYKARLDLFSNYKKNPQNIDLYMTNILSIKLGKIFSVTWSVDMIYDDDVRLFGKNKTSPALQLKSIIGIGLQVRFSSNHS